MAFDDGYLWISPSELSEGDKLTCHLVSPARIQQWIISGMLIISYCIFIQVICVVIEFITLDSHRWQNLKLCHEYIGKKECETCNDLEEEKRLLTKWL